MKRIVFSDIDGTLLKNDHSMSKITHDGIISLINKGIPFVIVTSRHPGGVYPILTKCDLKIPFIAYGGGLIIDENRKILYSNGFSKDLAKEVISFLKEKRFNCDANIYSYDEWFCENPDSKRVKQEESIVNCRVLKGNVDSCRGDVIHKILIMCEKENTKIIVSSLKEHFTKLEVIASCETLIEVNQIGVTKALGIKKMIDALGYKQDETIAFGDNFNDLSMLEYVKYPFLMENAPKEMKEIIKTTTSSNEDDGLIKALNKLGLL